MDAINPYSVSAVSGPNVAALVIGRSISRLMFHLPQAVFLAGDEEVMRPGENRTQWERTLLALESIYARLPSLNTSQAAKVQDVVRDVTEFLDSAMFAELRFEAFTHVNDAYESCSNDDPGQLLQTEMERLVSPQTKSICDAVYAALDRTQRTWFELGQRLDEGLCRNDAYLFITQKWPEPTPIEQVELTSFTARHGEQLSGSGSTYVAVGPGDLPLQRFWPADAERLWSMAGLGAEQANIFRSLRPEFGRRSFDTKKLVETIETLFRAAHFGAGRGLERLRVDPERNEIELDGISDQVDPDIVYLFLGLLEARGNTSLKKIKSKYSHIFSPNDKLARLLKRTPKRLAALLDHGRGKPITLQL